MSDNVKDKAIADAIRSTIKRHEKLERERVGQKQHSFNQDAAVKMYQILDYIREAAAERDCPE